MFGCCKDNAVDEMKGPVFATAVPGNSEPMSMPEPVVVNVPAPQPPKPAEFTISLERTGNATLGLELDYKDEKTLEIEGFRPQGMLVQYNANCLDGKIVKVGDRIVQVNDLSGNATKMIQECREKKVLLLKIRPKEMGPP